MGAIEHMQLYFEFYYTVYVVELIYIGVFSGGINVALTQEVLTIVLDAKMLEE